MSKVFYVIETANTTYWDGRETKEKARFTSSIHYAIKFYDFESCETVKNWVLDDPVKLRTVEHAYIDDARILPTPPVEDSKA